MTTSAVAVRRLPGFAFEARAPVYDDVLPRLDVAAFAGFAASGPVGVPVPVEDAAQFAAVFGDDATLAWDVAYGRPVRAQLAPAVRSFFANGGRRCWVVRLAGAARVNKHPVPGTAVVGEVGAVVPLVLAARSPGSWSDAVSLSTSLTSQRFGLLAWNRTSGELTLAGPSDSPLVAGDLLRITARDTDVVLYLGVESVSAHDAGQAATRRLRLRVRGGAARWFDTSRAPIARSGVARLASGNVPARYEGATSVAGGAPRVTVALEMNVRAAPRSGEVVVVDLGGETMLLAVQAAALSSASGSLPSVLVHGSALWVRRSAPTVASPLASCNVERLGLELWARTVRGEARRLTGLGLAPGHPRHVELLPDDETVYGGETREELAVWRDALVPRFPVAGRGSARLCIPFGVGALPDHALPARHDDATPLERDGLVPFDAALFGDEELADKLASTLLADAEYLRYLAPAPRPLVGLHRTLAIEEATLMAVPDASLPGWVRHEPAPLQPPAPTETADAAGTPTPNLPTFVDCSVVQVGEPVLEVEVHDADAAVVLEWSAADGTGPFVVEESTSRDWRGAAEVYRGDAQTTTLDARQPGDYYYRVRGVGDHPTRWSNGVAARVAGGGEWRIRRPAEYRDDVLVAVHRMLVRACAARRDCMAVLSLPEHYREGAASDHAKLLAARDAPDVALGANRVPGLGPAEAEALGFAALYHGWLHVRDGREVRSTPPDGAACGAIARRSNERGPWVGPANEPLRGVVALERPAAAAHWQGLQQLGINVVRHEPRGFVVLSADTLARDDDVRPISVRRLLILLRRVAMRLGTTYVFEPANDAFRRMVQRGFEAMLGDLFQRGAFAGSTAARAFEVVTDPSVNTRASVDQGRFIVELRVAPAHPMTFLTLRLVQTGERVLLTGD